MWLSMVEDYKRSGSGGEVDAQISVKSWKESIEEELGKGDDELVEEFIVNAKFEIKFVIRS
jgi:hypothetical protein